MWPGTVGRADTGGGISADGSCWISSRPDFLVPIAVLSALFRGRMLGMLINAHAAGRLQFFGDYQHHTPNRFGMAEGS